MSNKRLNASASKVLGVTVTDSVLLIRREASYWPVFGAFVFAGFLIILYAEFAMLDSPIFFLLGGCIGAGGFLVGRLVGTFYAVVLAQSEHGLLLLSTDIWWGRPKEVIRHVDAAGVRLDASKVIVDNLEFRVPRVMLGSLRVMLGGTPQTRQDR